MFTLEYISPSGELFSLWGGYRSHGVSIEAGTLEGLVAEIEENPVVAAGVPGQQVDFRDRVINPITGRFTVIVRDVQTWTRFRRAWSTRKYGQLQLTTTGGKKLVLPVRLSQPLESPADKPRRGSRKPVTVISDSALWSQEFSATGEVAIVNAGDVPVWPTIVWKGAGGKVTLPSGFTFDLPKVSQTARLPLDRRFYGKVFINGVADDDVSRAVAAVGEQVPVGETRTFVVPDGAQIVWTVQVLDPWA